MDVSRRSTAAVMFAILIVLLCPPLPAPAMPPQNAEVQQRLDEIKAGVARNKQALAQYHWQQQETVTVRGEVKRLNLFQVELGADGKPVRTPMAQDDENSSSSGRQHGILHKLMKKKAGEFEQYAQQIKELGQRYAEPDPERLQQAYQRGNVSIQVGDVAGSVRVVVYNYLKSGDSVTLLLNRARKELQGIHVSSYLKKPKDAVTLSAEFSRTPDDTNYISELTINGVSKKVTVAIKNFEYHKK